MSARAGMPSPQELLDERHPDAAPGWCRWCGKRIERPDGTTDLRRRWHPECNDEFQVLAYWEVMRRRALERDGGRCRACDLDLVDLDQELTRQRAAKGLPARRVPLGRLLVDSGFDPDRSLWEGDHVVPLADGGPHSLEWVWILCQVCHKKKTAAEAAARAGYSIGFRHVDGDPPSRHFAYWRDALRGAARCLP